MSRAVITPPRPGGASAEPGPVGAEYQTSDDGRWLTVKGRLLAREAGEALAKRCQIDELFLVGKNHSVTWDKLCQPYNRTQLLEHDIIFILASCGAAASRDNGLADLPVPIALTEYLLYGTLSAGDFFIGSSAGDSTPGIDPPQANRTAAPSPILDGIDGAPAVGREA